MKRNINPKVDRWIEEWEFDNFYFDLGLDKDGNVIQVYMILGDCFLLHEMECTSLVTSRFFHYAQKHADEILSQRSNVIEIEFERDLEMERALDRSTPDDEGPKAS